MADTQVQTIAAILSVQNARIPELEQLHEQHLWRLDLNGPKGTGPSDNNQEPVNMDDLGTGYGKCKGTGKGGNVEASLSSEGKSKGYTSAGEQVGGRGKANGSSCDGGKGHAQGKGGNHANGGKAKGKGKGNSPGNGGKGGTFNHGKGSRTKWVQVRQQNVRKDGRPRIHWVWRQVPA